ncbi:unnamed protein product [Menidia menidia]|uniref:Monocarboxylate transporter 7 n=1 Tax=Menidia menidia TaxID=238744 RepID=A0A8S4B164_9TELE|nr:unnamed protein product [Menidia menidia]
MTLCRTKMRHLLGPNVYAEPPDGGWGWMIAVAFFLVELFTYGTIKSFGIFLQDLMQEFGETNSRVSWIVSICVFVMTFNGPLSSVLTNRFGFQVVVMIGGLLISAGTIATSFCSSLNQIYITYGVVAGLGYCLTFLPTVTILSKYFNHRRSLVTAVASTGESLSMFALAPAFSALRDSIGWRHTMAVIGALQSIIIICGVMLRPIIIKPPPKETEALRTQEKSEGTNPEDSETKDNQQTGESCLQPLKDSSNSAERALLPKGGTSKEEIKESETEKTDVDAEKEASSDEETKSGDQKPPAKNSRLLDFSILRECSFILYSLFGLFATLGFFAPTLYIIELSVSRGVERDKAAYMLSTIAVAEILGRFSIGWVLTRRALVRRKLLVLLACVLAMTADLVGFTLVSEFYGLAVCCGLYGFFMGTLACTHIPMLAEDEVVGIERMSSAAGVYVFIQSFAGLAGPPLGGVLVDATQNYGSAFYSCAVGMGLSAVFLGLVKPAKTGALCGKRRRRRRGFKPPEDECERSRGQKPDSNNDCPEPDGDLDPNQARGRRDTEGCTAYA